MTEAQIHAAHIKQEALLQERYERHVQAVRTLHHMSGEAEHIFSTLLTPGTGFEFTEEERKRLEGLREANKRDLKELSLALLDTLLAPIAEARPKAIVVP